MGYIAYKTDVRITSHFRGEIDQAGERDAGLTFEFTGPVRLASEAKGR